MAIISNLRKALILRKHLKNWFAVGLALHNHQNVDLLFRDGTKILDVESRTVHTLFFSKYCEYLHCLGVCSSKDLLALNDIALDISQKLKAAFIDEEKVGGGHFGPEQVGGYFGPKELLLFSVIRKFKPVRIVETGVAQGVSSYAILKALQLNGQGKLISIDLPNRNPNGYRYHDGTLDTVYTPPDLMPGWLVPEELRKFWVLKLGRSSEVLPTLDGSVDMFFHDSEHSYENMAFEYNWAYSHLSKGGIITSDDIGWNTAFRDFAEAHKDMKPIFNVDRGNARARALIQQIR